MKEGFRVTNDIPYLSPTCLLTEEEKVETRMEVRIRRTGETVNEGEEARRMKLIVSEGFLSKFEDFLSDGRIVEGGKNSIGRLSVKKVGKE